ncbi:MAG: D-glycero-beta-D-manno-heptose 1-phosphate adenylyltransferase [Planctomycetes bacterium]|nr:D-glycero-beta-D-manno-heptose 1-phosphate adenylyltransferase [Planctomycetota bacterium]
MSIQLPPSGSVLSGKALAEAVRKLQRRGRRVVWTNGCFDLLHAGHLAILEGAKKLGDVLIVGLNSDASTRKLKGAGRPINSQQDRARLLAALRPVDYVTVFRGTTPLPLLQRVKPDIFVKGGDYTLETMHHGERRAVESYGGKIRFLPFVKGYSSTKSLRKLKLK